MQFSTELLQRSVSAGTPRLISFHLAEGDCDAVVDLPCCQSSVGSVGAALQFEITDLFLFFSVFCFVLAVIVGGVVGALFAAFLVMLLVYRMKKKDEGSYTLEEPKQATVTYQKPDKQEEFYA